MPRIAPDEVFPTNIDDGVPVPGLMNCWKHFTNVIRTRIDLAAKQGESGVAALPEKLVSIGGALMDLYFGPLGPVEVVAEITTQLKESNRLDRPAYKPWLDEAGGYRTVTLSDSSKWVLRWSPLEDRYLHLHPGRYSPHTIRAGANQLKTAIMSLAFAQWRGLNPFEMAVVNDARKFLQFGPVDVVRPYDGVGELLTILSQGGRAHWP